MTHKAWSRIAEVRYCFSRTSIKFQGHTWTKNWVFPYCNSRLNLPMATKWCTKLELGWESCPIVFQGHPSNFKVKWDKKSSIFTQIGGLRTVTPVWIYQWLWNDAQSFKYVSRGVLLFCKIICQISRLHGWKIVHFDPSLVFPDSNSSLNSRDGYKTMHKAWSSIEEVPYCFQGHLSNFKVTRDRKSLIFTWIECFQAVTLVWIHRWLQNDAQCLI